MTATLVAKDLAAGHGDRTLFAGLDLVVAPGDVIGLVGVNGAGKSSLLRLLAGLDRPEEGELRLSPPTATVGHLPQEPERRAGETVREFLARRTGVADAQAAMDAATQGLVDGAPGADDAYSETLERWLALGGADLDERAEEVAAELGLTVGLDLPMTALSGGQAARAGLASSSCPATTSSCWTSPPTTSIWTAWSGWSAMSRGSARARWSSATTANS